MPTSRFSKINRITVNASHEAAAMFDRRMQELPIRYKSRSDWFLALALRDCMLRRPHVTMPKILNQLPRARDTAIAKIVSDFDEGRFEGDHVAAGDEMMEVLVHRLTHLASKVEKLTSQTSAKPAPRRR